MSITIVTDSTCDLPESLISQYGITVVPLYINIGSESYRDGIDMSREEFYRRLPAVDPPPTTAAPGMDTFIQVYEELAARGASRIISIHISETLSNVVNVARLAAERTDVVPVTVIDSGQLTLGVGLAVCRAAKAAKAGSSMEEVVASVREQIPLLYTFAVLDTVEFLRRSGRLTQFQSGLATLLKIKPLLKMNDGVTDMERIRTNRKAFERLIKLVSDLGPLEQLHLVHTNAPERTAALHRQARHLVPEGTVPLYAQVTPVIGSHIGPGAVGFVCAAKSNPGSRTKGGKRL